MTKTPHHIPLGEWHPVSKDQSIEQLSVHGSKKELIAANIVDRSYQDDIESIYVFRAPRHGCLKKPVYFLWEKRPASQAHLSWAIQIRNPLSDSEKEMFSYRIFKAWLNGAQFLGFQSDRKAGFLISQYRDFGGDIGIYAREKNVGKFRQFEPFLLMGLSGTYDLMSASVRCHRDFYKKGLLAYFTSLMTHEIAHTYFRENYFSSRVMLQMMRETRSYMCQYLYCMTRGSLADLKTVRVKMTEKLCDLCGKDGTYARDLALLDVSMPYNSPQAMDKIHDTGVYCALINIASQFAKIDPKFREFLKKDPSNFKTQGLKAILHLKGARHARALRKYAQATMRMSAREIYLLTEKNKEYLRNIHSAHASETPRKIRGQASMQPSLLAQHIRTSESKDK